MHPNTLRNKLSGVMAFPITPFKEDLSLDLPALHQNLTSLLNYQISAIVAAGGTGEMYSLTAAEYTRVIELTALAVEDRVPVIAGVGFGQRLAIEMAQTADIPYDPKRPSLGTFPMRSGSTLLISKPPLKDGIYGPGQLRYLIRKRLGGPYGEKRQRRQRSFLLNEGLLEGNDPKRFELNFNMLHSGF